MALGYPLYVNGREVRGPITISHRPTAGLGHPYRPGFGSTAQNPLVRQRPGFGSTAQNPLVRQRPGFGDDALTAALPGVVVIPKELATQVPEAARIPAVVPTAKAGEILALVELEQGKYAWTSGSEGKFSAPTPVPPNYTHFALAAAAGAGITLLALKVFGKKR